MEFDGLGETTARIREIGEKVERDTAKILNLVGQPRIAKIKNRTPVKDGHLKASVRLSPAKRTRQGVEVYWQAGGTTTAYAHRQHEDMSFKHKVGEAKFIINVIYEDASAMKSELSKEFKKIFKGLEVI